MSVMTLLFAAIGIVVATVVIVGIGIVATRSNRPATPLQPPTDPPPES
ncbi:MAG TPA: hypothetical protein PKK40_07685 [Marmoricola sp.]|nr:hypothetical protein [Marmoricola sp.]